MKTSPRIQSEPVRVGMSRDWKPLMQKVWSSIDSWKGKHTSLQQPAPSPAQGLRSREAVDTHLDNVLLCRQLVFVVSDREAYVRQARQSSAVYEKLDIVHWLRWDPFGFLYVLLFEFKAFGAGNSEFTTEKQHQADLQLTLPSSFPVLSQTSPAAQTTAP